MSQKYLDIDPNNVPASGKVSFKNGNPVLTFTVGRQNAFLDLSSLRVGGVLNIWRDAAGTLHPIAGGGAGNSSEAMASQKLGVYGAFDQVIFRHAETKQVAEHIRHYARFMSSYLPTLAGSQDQLGHLQESALIMPNYNAFQRAVVRNTQGSNFCVPIPSGMTLGGGALPLNQFPLEIEIHLSPDSQFFYSTDGITTNMADVFYELSDLSLTCECVVPEGQMSEKAGAFSFNSITSYFNTLESTNSIINYNLALSKVLGAFVNFVPSNFVNNLSQDGFLTYMPAKVATGGIPAITGGQLADLQTISFLRNGERFPYQFETKTNFKTDNQVQVADPQVIKQFLSSIIPEDIHNRCSVSPVNCNRSFTVNDSTTTSYRLIPEGGAAWGVGVLYDMLDSEGVDFTNAQFSIQMTNTLDDGNPISAYLFIKHKTTIAFNENGVQVIS